MKKILALLFTLAIAVAAFVGCGASGEQVSVEEPAAEKIEIEHNLGTTEVPLNPKKLVVMDFGMLDTIDFMDLDVELAIPANNLPSYLSKYSSDEYLNIGGLKDFDIEAINNFAPDVIILGARQQDAYDEISQIAPTLLMSPNNEDYLNSSIKNIENLAKMFGEQQKVEQEIASVKAEMDSVKDSVQNDQSKTLILLTNEGNLSVYGPGSRFGIIHDSFGFPAVDESIEASTHGQEVNYEYISKMNPDYIFVVDRTAAIGGEILADKTLSNELVDSTNAAQNGRIIMLNPDIWYLSGGGLQSLSEMTAEVVAAIK